MFDYKKILYITCLFSCIMIAGCKKWIQVDPPVDTITTGDVFTTDKQAEWALSGIYSKLVNGQAPGNMIVGAMENFGSGQPAFLGGLSSDELIPSPSANNGVIAFLATNSLNERNSAVSDKLWLTAYKSVYDINAILEGLAASDAPLLTAPARSKFRGEALALRAFAYFYLVNFYGDVPLVLTTDVYQAARMRRTPVAEVNAQIIRDLQESITLLDADFSAGAGERVRVNKCFAQALLARVSLYMEDFPAAVAHASSLIGNTALFGLEQDLNRVFRKGSRETILELMQTNQDPELKNATAIGMLMNAGAAGQLPQYYLTEGTASLFDPADKRKQHWISDLGNQLFGMHKYKTGNHNAVFMAPQEEYLVVMRLAELYLIRAEAIARMQGGVLQDAIRDINVLRKRADAPELDENLPQAEVLALIREERQLELFGEWGHRWLDLKRTGMAEAVLSELRWKQPWQGEHQLLYPIPATEIAKNNNLVQNPKHNVQ
ncbi:RagB/SusD family nutrient uptake outer membrane protein [Chitinophaga sp.]|uniref:RagB/SusD family nutrient uptake outer membrane protein n=1 Tax=Chitinophaga sp. TaxID=1869181 RepID=UPI0026370F12|nr:RagB/SusD family nutrient uptake outer membrane protein [uncultured Chitinophaga sp.]